MMRILLVEDDQKVARVPAKRLHEEGNISGMPVNPTGGRT